MKRRIERMRDREGGGAVNEEGVGGGWMSG